MITLDLSFRNPLLSDASLAKEVPCLTTGSGTGAGGGGGGGRGLAFGGGGGRGGGGGGGGFCGAPFFGPGGEGRTGGGGISLWASSEFPPEQHAPIFERFNFN